MSNDEKRVSIGDNIKDRLYVFLQEPIKENFSTLMYTETGEYDYIDFKLNWIDNETLIKEILAIANSGGGVLIFGVEEEKDGTFSAVGLEKLKDKADVNKAIEQYLPSTVKYEIHDFNYNESEYSKLANKKFQVLSVEYDPANVPYIAEKATGKIQSGMIFIRRGTNISLANNDEVKKLIKCNMDATYSLQSNLKLEAHLDQLQILYSRIDKYRYVSKAREGFAFMGLLQYFDTQKEVENEKYPEEDYDDFIVKMIELKKIKIEKVLDIK